MTRTSAQNKARTKAMSDYRWDQKGDCELSRWLLADRDAVREMARCRYYTTEIHHICGRGRSEEHEFYCNLIQLSAAAHIWCETHVHKGQIACWYAKYRKHLAQVEHPTNPERFEWNVDVTNRLIAPCVSLVGKLENMIESVGPGMYADYADEILNDINASDVEF